MKFTGTSLKKNLIDNLFEQVLGLFMYCFCVVCKVCEESLNVQRILKQNVEMQCVKMHKRLYWVSSIHFAMWNSEAGNQKLKREVYITVQGYPTVLKEIAKSKTWLV